MVKRLSYKITVSRFEPGSERIYCPKQLSTMMAEWLRQGGNSPVVDNDISISFSFTLDSMGSNPVHSIKSSLEAQ